MRHRLIVILCASQAACAAATREVPAETAADVRAKIEANNAAFSRHVAAAQPDSLAALYTTDAVLMLGNAPAAKGAAAIRGAFAGLVEQDASITLTTDEVVLADSVAVEHGEYALRVRSRADTTQVLMQDRGHYLVTWRKRDGRWQMFWDIATSDQPLPGTPAAAPATP